MSLRSKLIRLASADPELRPHLLPLLKTAGYVEIPGVGGYKFPTKRLSAWLYHGGGGGGLGFGSDLGRGIYWAYEPDYAANFGRTIWKAKVELGPVLELPDDALDEICQALLGESWDYSRGDRDLIKALQATKAKGIDHQTDDGMESEVVDWAGKTKRLLSDENIVSTTGIQGVPWEVTEGGNRRFSD